MGGEVGVDELRGGGVDGAAEGFELTGLYNILLADCRRYSDKLSAPHIQNRVVLG